MKSPKRTYTKLSFFSRKSLEKPKKKSLFLKVTLFLLFIFGIFLIYTFFPILTYAPRNLPERIFITDRNGEIITDKANEYGYKIPGTVNLENKFIKSLLQIEDKHFQSHLGVNILSKIRAFKNNLTSGEIVSGGSTITEQYIKNTYFPRHARNYLQKARESFLAFSFSLTTSKEEILQKYLQNLYFGNNIYGVKAAIKVYFGKEKLETLTDEEITILLTLLRKPSVKSLYNKSFLSYFETVKKRLGFDFERTIFDISKAPNLDTFPFVTTYFPENIGKSTIDAKLQNFAKETIKEALENLKQKNVTNAAVFALDPKTMEVLIYLGSRDFYSKKVEGQVDVVRAIRQPGSTFKPFLYLLALQKGAGVNSLLLDIESQYDSFQNGKVYISENYSLKEYGLISLQRALGNSLNNATVRLARELGLEKVFEHYKTFGFRFIQQNPKHYGYSFVLGNPSLTLENMVLAYVNLLPNYETLKQRNYFFKYEENEKKLQRRYEKNTTKYLDINKFLLYKILKNPDNRDISFGVHSFLTTSIPQAVKTGTSSNFKDNLVISYHPDLVIGVWVGNNNNSSMIGVTGISGAGYIWHKIIERAISLGYIKDLQYEIPKGISEVYYCLDEKCFMKKANFDKQNIEYFSKMADTYYDKRDLIEKLDTYERKRLDDLGFELE